MDPVDLREASGEGPESRLSGDLQQPGRVAPFLILAWGNRSRGDDALGPAFLDAVRGDPRWWDSGLSHQVDLLEDFQLQPEHVYDLEGRVGVLFVDAATGLENPSEITDLIPVRLATPLSHHMLAGVLLGVYETVHRRAPPPAWQLAIRAREFGLGRPICEASLLDLHEAVDAVLDWLPRVIKRPDV